MKPLNYFLIAIIIFPLVSFCQKDNNIVMPMGDGIYMVTQSAKSGFVSLGKLRNRCYVIANEFAAKNNAIAEVISVNEIPTAPFVFPQVDLKFRLVEKSNTLADPNNNSISISSGYSANGKITDGNISVKKSQNEKEKEKLERLEKIGVLFKEGILSKEEFENEKHKILSE